MQHLPPLGSVLAPVAHTEKNNFQLLHWAMCVSLQIECAPLRKSPNPSHLDVFIEIPVMY